MAELELRLRDFVSKEMKRMGRNMKKEATAMQKVWKGVSRAVVGVGLALKIAFAAAVFKGLRTGVQRAMEFSHAMQEVRTIMDETSMSFEDASSAVSDLALSLGRSEIEVSKALYQTLSAGVTDTAEAMMLLNQAGRLGVAALMTTNEAVDLLTNTFNAYGMEISERTLTATSDLMQQTIRLGKVVGPELAHSLGYVMPIASNLGVSLEELNAMLASLTLGGMNANMAATQLRQAFAQLLHPTDDAKELLHEYGLDVSAARVQAEGFLPVLRSIREAFGGNAKALQTLFPNIRGLIGIMALAGNQFEDVQRIMGEFEGAAGATEDAFDKMQNSLQVKMNKLQEAWAQAWKSIGESMLGVMEEMTPEEVDQRADAIRAIGEANAESWRILGAAISATIASIGASIKPLADLATWSTRPFIDAWEDVGDSIDKAQSGDFVGWWVSGMEALGHGIEGAAGPLRLLWEEGEKAGEVFAEWGSAFDPTIMTDAAKENINLLIEQSQEQRAYTLAIIEQERVTNDLTDAGVARRKDLEAQAAGLGDMVKQLRGTLDMMEQIKTAQAAIEGLEADIPIRAKALLRVDSDVAREAIAKIQQEVDRFVAQGGLIAHLELDVDTSSLMASEAKRLAEVESLLKKEEAAYLLMMEGRVEGASWASEEEAKLHPGAIKLHEDMLRWKQKNAEGYLADITEATVNAEKDLLDRRKFFLQLEDELGLQDSKSKKARVDEQMQLDIDLFKNKRDAAWEDLSTSEEFALMSEKLQRKTAREFRKTWDADTAYYIKLLKKRSRAQKKEFDGDIVKLKGYAEHAKEELTKLGKWSVTLGAQIGLQLREAVTDLLDFEGGLGSIESLVQPTAYQELVELNTIIAVAEQNWISLLGTTATDEEIFIARQNIDNVKEFALQEAIAAEQTERLGYALRDIKGLVGVDLAEALGTAGTSLAVLGNLYVPTAADNLRNFDAQVEQARLELAAFAKQNPGELEKIASLENLITRMGEYRKELVLAQEAEALLAENDRLKESLSDLDLSFSSIAEHWDDIGKSFKLGIQGWMESVGDLNAQIQDLAAGAMNALVSETMNFIDGTKSAKEAWKDYAKTFFKLIAEMILQLQIKKLLEGWGWAEGGTIEGGTGDGAELAMGGLVKGGVGRMIPLASGGVVSGGLGRVLPVHGYLKGGPIVDGPHVALIGEGKMNEAVVPLPDGKSIPVSMSGGGGTSISINIDAIDSGSVKTMLIDEASTLTNIIRNAMDEDRLFHTTFSR